jgi:hypothetical protein
MRSLLLNNGETFGYWKVIDNTLKPHRGKLRVKVRCKCGEEVIRYSCDLIAGRTKGCKKCRARERTPKIKIGGKYKEWTVLEQTVNKSRNIVYLCECSCGNRGYQSASDLLNPDRCFSCIKCSKRQEKQCYKTFNVAKYNKYERSAKTRNIEFAVSIEYLWNQFKKQKQICAITGDYLPDINKASLDRIDSKKGYVEGNVQWVTIQANKSKHILSMEELYDFCKKVLNHANQQPSTPLTKCEGSETNS